MAQLAMVIDLRKCAGCGACAIACKMENNTPDARDGQTFNWADYFVQTTGDFPNLDVTFLPVLCNHCTDAPCISNCPVNPKALYKTSEGITVRDDSRCIGCQICQTACPYSSKDISKDGVQYSVNSFNKHSQPTHPFWTDTTEVIPGCTASGKAVADKAGSTPPNQNEYTGAPYASVRKPGVMEKCNFCYHRTANGEKPWCVESCPADARVFGDISDPASDASKLLAKYQARRLKNNKGEFLAASETGTRPNVYYVNEFTTR